MTNITIYITDTSINTEEFTKFITCWSGLILSKSAIIIDKCWVDYVIHNNNNNTIKTEPEIPLILILICCNFKSWEYIRELSYLYYHIIDTSGTLQLSEYLRYISINVWQVSTSSAFVTSPY